MSITIITYDIITAGITDKKTLDRKTKNSSEIVKVLEEAGCTLITKSTYGIDARIITADLFHKLNALVDNNDRLVVISNCNGPWIGKHTALGNWLNAHLSE